MARKKIKNYSGRNFKRERQDDSLERSARSKLMSRIRSKDTAFERDFIDALKKSTRARFAINVPVIRGKPDIVFMKQKVCVFLDSNFWHGWQYPRWKGLLKNDFWRNKIEQNRKRDSRNTAYLRRTGWKVIRLWEHQIKNSKDQTVNSVLSLLR